MPPAQLCGVSVVSITGERSPEIPEDVLLCFGRLPGVRQRGTLKRGSERALLPPRQCSDTDTGTETGANTDADTDTDTDNGGNWR